ncbi:MAG: GNAT family N-acetyltransferase [Ginsengibacter sp.]
MENPSFIIRNMEPGDINSAIKLSDAAGWNQTEKDWQLLIENVANVCLLAETDDKVIIGTTTAINYSNEVAWIGMVLVDKQYQGHGISKSLLANIFKKLGGIKSIKLDATPEGQVVYKKLDFIDEYAIVRLINSSVTKVLSPGDDLLTEPVESQNLGEIIDLDEFIFGANRKQLITPMLNEYPASAWLLKNNGRISGFSLGRDGKRYHQVGPVVASTTLEAKLLITKALNNLIDQPVVVDVLADKEEMVDWLHSIGFSKQRHFTRMYKEENILPGISSKQYLIAGPEFG